MSDLIKILFIDTLGDDIAIKDWPVVPRVGEYVLLPRPYPDNAFFKVTGVFYHPRPTGVSPRLLAHVYVKHAPLPEEDSHE